MHCTNCGQEVPDTAKVCGYCGHRLKAEVRPPQPAPPRPIPEPPPSAPATTRPGISGWVWGVGGVLLLLIVGAGIWIALSSGGTTAPAPVNTPRPARTATSAPNLGPTATAEWLWEFFYRNNTTWSTLYGGMAWAFSGERLTEARDPYWTWMGMTPDVQAQDLMLGAEIVWESESTHSGAGCGFVFRRNDDDYYVARIGRDGTAFLQVVVRGEGQPDLASVPVASVRTADGATNTFVVTARGPYLTLSVNGEMVIAVEDDTLQRGLAAPLVSNYGGQRTMCTFNNGGLWVVPPD